MDIYTGRIGIIWHTGIVSSVGKSRGWNDQRTYSSTKIRADVDSQVQIEIYHSTIVIPENRPKCKKHSYICMYTTIFWS